MAEDAVEAEMNHETQWSARRSEPPVRTPALHREPREI